MSDRPTEIKTPASATRSAAHPAVTFLIITSIGFAVELLIMRLIEVPESVLGRNLTDLLDAGVVGFVVVPFAALIAVYRHDRTDIHLDKTFAGWRGRGIATTILITGMAVSLFAAWIAHRQAVKGDIEHLNMLAHRMQDNVTARLQMFQRGLRGSRSLWASNKLVERDEFSAMVRSRDLPTEFPGSVGMGYAQRVPIGQIDEFLQTTRRDHAPDFKMQHLPGTSELWMVSFVECVDPDVQLAGLDLQSIPALRNAAERALGSGTAQLSEPVTLASDAKRRLLVFWLLPTFRDGPANPGSSMAATDVEGWVFMPVHIAPVFASLSTDLGGELDMEFFQGTRPIADKLVFDSNNHSADHDDEPEMVTARAGRMCQHLPIDMGGQTWLLTLQPTAKFQYAGRELVWALGGAAR